MTMISHRSLSGDQDLAQESVDQDVTRESIDQDLAQGDQDRTRESSGGPRSNTGRFAG